MRIPIPPELEDQVREISGETGMTQMWLSSLIYEHVFRKHVDLRSLVASSISGTAVPQTEESHDAG
jgi:hypothetical protein